MIERIDDMAPNTIGFRAKGKLTREDQRNVLEPVDIASRRIGPM